MLSAAHSYSAIYLTAGFLVWIRIYVTYIYTTQWLSHLNDDDDDEKPKNTDVFNRIVSNLKMRMEQGFSDQGKVWEKEMKNVLKWILKLE